MDVPIGNLLVLVFKRTSRGFEIKSKKETKFGSAPYLNFVIFNTLVI